MALKCELETIPTWQNFFNVLEAEHIRYRICSLFISSQDLDWELCKALLVTTLIG